jgi:DNA-binding response OmpR family regulator
MPIRPTIIVAEPEPLEALSVRKLVLETAKFNVLTAHSTREAIDLFQAFPNSSAVVAVEGRNIDCEIIASTIKDATAKIPIIALSARAGFKVEQANYHVSSHEPEQLLQLVRKLLGDPRTLDADARPVEGAGKLSAIRKNPEPQRARRNTE